MNYEENFNFQQLAGILSEMFYCTPTISSRDTSSVRFLMELLCCCLIFSTSSCARFPASSPTLANVASNRRTSSARQRKQKWGKHLEYVSFSHSLHNTNATIPHPWCVSPWAKMRPSPWVRLRLCAHFEPPWCDSPAVDPEPCVVQTQGVPDTVKKIYEASTNKVDTSMTWIKL